MQVVIPAVGMLHGFARGGAGAGAQFGCGCKHCKGEEVSKGVGVDGSSLTAITHSQWRPCAAAVCSRSRTTAAPWPANRLADWPPARWA